MSVSPDVGTLNLAWHVLATPHAFSGEEIERIDARLREILPADNPFWLRWEPMRLERSGAK